MLVADGKTTEYDALIKKDIRDFYKILNGKRALNNKKQNK